MDGCSGKHNINASNTLKKKHRYHLCLKQKIRGFNASPHPNYLFTLLTEPVLKIITVIIMQVESATPRCTSTVSDPTSVLKVAILK